MQRILTDLEVALLVGRFDPVVGCQCVQNTVHAATPYTGAIQVTPAFEPTRWQRFLGKRACKATYREAILYHHHVGLLVSRCPLCRLLDHLEVEPPAIVTQDDRRRTLTVMEACPGE